MFYLLNGNGNGLHATLPSGAGPCDFWALLFSKRCIAAVTFQYKREPADHGFCSPLRAVLGAGRGAL